MVELRFENLSSIDLALVIQLRSLLALQPFQT